GGGAAAPGANEVAARQLRSFVLAGEVRKMAACAIGFVCGKPIRRLGGRVHHALAPAGNGGHRKYRDGGQERRFPDKHFRCAFYRKPAMPIPCAGSAAQTARTARRELLIRQPNNRLIEILENNM